MTTLAPAHQIRTTPQAPAASTIVAGNARITVLTQRLLRIEWSPSATFEDRATQVVWNRDLPTPQFTLVRRGDTVHLRTPYLILDYDGGPFTPSGLRVQVQAVSHYQSLWRYGTVDAPEHFGVPTNLLGTARTLDEADGAIPLEPGLVSTTGYGELDDSRSLALDAEGWVAPREEGAVDLYLFCHGFDFPAALADFYAITGPQPLLPRYALGNWWSRYHPYTATEYQDLITRFESEQIPFSVAVLDMDWHLVDVDPMSSSGWTGYTWNRDLFPDPPAFLAWLHEHGLRVCLNVHPADGIRCHEDCYPQVARHLGIDPQTRQPIDFDLVNPRFREAYFDLVHHRLEEQGVDFWWLDWQQGPYSSVPGLDPLWLLNHLHFLDSGRDGRRPLTFSRYAGPGSHRYPVGFSGDSVISWQSLHFQPYFTATAANIGYGWWSHDIGGHMFGVKDDELATRWVQLGVFSPINRLHSTLNPFNSKEPWRFHETARRVQTDFLRLRHRMLPYLYTMNRRAHEGRPIVEPLYWSLPSQDAMPHRTTFSFGSELLVAPITTPADQATGLGSVRTFLPPGLWWDVFTGVGYDGSRPVSLHRDLESLPVLARAGAIWPLTGPDELGVGNPSSLEVRVYAGADGELVLYEDDDAATPQEVRTRLSLDWAGGSFRIGAAEGDWQGVVAPVRSWKLVLVGAGRVPVEGYPTSWDEATGSLTVDLGEVPTGAGLTLRLGDLQICQPDLRQRWYGLVDRAQVPFADKDQAMAALARPTPAEQARELVERPMDATLRAALLELVLARA